MNGIMTVRDLTILGCSSQQPTRNRNHGAYLLRWNEEGFLFDPGEGTQRQFIFANLAPTVVTRILISHFHGDHCLGLGSMIMRLNLDKVKHDVHCYYPLSGKKYFDRLRYGTIYHETVNIIEHPVEEAGIVHEDEKFQIEAAFLDHSVDCIGWKIKESDRRKFSKEKLNALGVRGEMVRELKEKGRLLVDGKAVLLDEVSETVEGDRFSIVIDTRMCQNAIDIARGAKMFLCESTYLDREKELAWNHYHLTAREAAMIAKEANVEHLLLTHFSARYRTIEEFERESRAVFPNARAVEDMSRFSFPRNKTALR